jgi:hypothetical protein
MARTKKQAKARRSESAQLSTAANDGEGSRPGTTIAAEKKGDASSSTTSSDRTRRAQRRETTSRQRAGKAATMDDGHGDLTESEEESD